MSSLDTSHSDNNSNTSYIDAYKALLKHRHWVVALSGGLDSTVLLHSVYHFLQTLPNAESNAPDTSSSSAFIPTLTAIHINHQLQTVSDSWEQHCQSVCDGLGVSLQIKKVAVQSEGKGLENAARQARYAVFEESLSTDAVLLMGHHANDQAETLLMRLFRGAGTRGAAAIPMQRSLGQSQIARPLLKCNRVDLAAYASLNDLRFIEDPSNTDENFDRNFVRQQVLPKLEKRWPAIVSMLNRYSDHASADSELLTDLAQLDLKSVDCANDKYGDSLSIAA
ncbi:MAG: tRNA lysidine(34) synthetase TilS, partial [Pseudomonadales bacterium]|nr:tRNA lysidine(34) synthetase TilS [Pseudomonadales bacterium]